MTSTETTTPNLSDDQKAVVAKYGFEVVQQQVKRMQAGKVQEETGFILKDQVVRQASHGRDGHYSGTSIEMLLQAAVAKRKVLDEPSAAPKSEKPAKSPIKRAKKPAGTTPPTDGAGTASADATQTNTADNETSVSDARTASATKTKTKNVDKKEPKQRKDNRYLRAFRSIIKNPAIDPSSLGKEASMSKSMAGSCIIAWNAAIQVLGEPDAQGFMKLGSVEVAKLTSAT